MRLLPFLRKPSSAPAAPVGLEEKLLASLLAMAWMVEARDPYTGGHLWRVAQFSRLLAEETGCSGTETARIAIGGFLHDLGKVGIPDAILKKKDRLSDEEYAVIKTHPDIGMRLLAGHPLATLAEDAVLRHHETPDGRGYPQGLPLARIPLVARIVGLCDAFDAMTSTRPYRRGMPIAQALTILEENLGRQFDRELGERFIALGRAGRLDAIVGHSDEGIPLRECLMCGPVVVVRREQQTGDAAFCHCCGGEYRLSTDGHGLEPTGARGTAADLQPATDGALIARFVAATADAARLSGLVAA